MIVSISPEAERELTDVAIFYAEQESAELGLAFIVEFERALELLRGIRDGNSNETNVMQENDDTVGPGTWTTSRIC